VNRDCYGDFFTVAGRDRYRCRLDGTLLDATDLWLSCPHCGRRIAGNILTEVDLSLLVAASAPGGEAWNGPIVIPRPSLRAMAWLLLREAWRRLLAEPHERVIRRKGER
jgi:hypothetical protein